jgi:hypothetical protein
MRHSLSSVKKLSLALGVAGIGVLAGLPALAQSTPSGGTPEFKLSKEGYVILCNRTPMNSRCEGSPYHTSSSSQSPVQNPALSPSGTTAPTQNLPSETDETKPSSAGESRSPGSMMQGGMMHNGSGMMRPGSSSSSPSSVGTPSNTTAPTENLPSESEPPSTQNQSPTPRSMQGGSPSGGAMGSPSNTTAPTQTLPSETDHK